MKSHKLPKQFSTTIKEISLPQAVSEDEEVLSENCFINLARIIIQNSQFFDADSNVLVPDRVQFQNRQYSLNYSIQQHIPLSIQSQLYGSEIPIILVCETYMRLGTSISKTKNLDVEQSGNSTGWGDVISALLNQITLLNGDEVLNGRISAVQHLLKGPMRPSPIRVLPDKEEPGEFYKIIHNWLLKIFSFPKPGVSKVTNSKALHVPIGSAQNSAIPFVWNNCSQRCKFCYVDKGFSTIQYPRGWIRSQNDIKEVLNAYDPKTRYGHASMRFALMDWEPTERPDFIELLKIICAADPKAQVPILTHGGNLTRKLLKAVAMDHQLRAQVLFQVSLNSANPFYRKLIMPGGRPEQHDIAIGSLPLMNELGIQFDVSIVAATNWLPLQDIEQTIRYADKHEPTSYIRVALPAGTRYHNPKLLLQPGDLATIDAFVCDLRSSINTPLVVTVGLLNRLGLTPIIEDVVPGSSADQAGIPAGSMILQINSNRPRSRTEAIQLLNQSTADNMFVSVQTPNGEQKNVDLSTFRSLKQARTLVDKKVGAWGILMYEDVDFSIFRRIAEYQVNHRLDRPVIVTSKVMKPFMEAARELLRPDEEVRNLRIVAAPNRHFGGNICIAGLLTLEDIAIAIKEQKVDGDSYFISSTMISRGGVDLAGRHVNELRAQIKKPVFSLQSLTSAL